MEKPVVGVNVPSCGLGGLKKALAQIADDGWQAAELNIANCPFLIGGRVQEPVVECARKIMDGFGLHYTGHLCYDVDLRDPDDIHRQALLSSLEVCARLGIDRLNIHFEQFSHDRAREERYRERVTEGAELGAKLGVALNVENVEVEDYRYGLDFVRELAHPNVGMTLDLGHLWVSANYFHYDYLEAVQACAPMVRHIHINDNDGVFEPLRLENKPLYDTLRMGWRMTLSRGDIHVPPFWGTAPLDKAFGVLKRAGYPGIWLCEYYSGVFHPLNPRIRERVEQEIQKA